MGSKANNRKPGITHPRGLIKKETIFFLIDGRKNTTEIREFLINNFNIKEKTNVMRHLEDLIKLNIIKKIKGEVGFADSFEIRDDYIAVQNLYDFFNKYNFSEELLNSNFFRELSVGQFLLKIPILLTDAIFPYFFEFYNDEIKIRSNFKNITINQIIKFIQNFQSSNFNGNMNFLNIVNYSNDEIMKNEMIEKISYISREIFLPMEKICEFAQLFSSPSAIKFILNINRLTDQQKIIIAQSYLLYFYGCVEKYKLENPDFAIKDFDDIFEAILSLKNKSDPPFFSLIQSHIITDYFDNNLLQDSYHLRYSILTYLSNDEDQKEAIECIEINGED